MNHNTLFVFTFVSGPILLVVLAIPILTMLANRSGWTTLAQRFRATTPVGGRQILVRHAAMGREDRPVGYGKAITLTLNDAGLGVSMIFFFRYKSPPLFIPWATVTQITRKEGTFRTSAVVHLRDQWPVIVVSGKEGEQLREFYVRVRTGGAG